MSNERRSESPTPAIRKTLRTRREMDLSPMRRNDGLRPIPEVDETPYAAASSSAPAAFFQLPKLVRDTSPYWERLGNACLKCPPSPPVAQTAITNPELPIANWYYK